MKEEEGEEVRGETKNYLLQQVKIQGRRKGEIHEGRQVKRDEKKIQTYNKETERNIG